MTELNRDKALELYDKLIKICVKHIDDPDIDEDPTEAIRRRWVSTLSSLLACLTNLLRDVDLSDIKKRIALLEGKKEWRAPLIKKRSDKGGDTDE